MQIEPTIHSNNHETDSVWTRSTFPCNISSRPFPRLHANSPKIMLNTCRYYFRDELRIRNWSLPGPSLKSCYIFNTWLCKRIPRFQRTRERKCVSLRLELPDLHLYTLPRGVFSHDEALLCYCLYGIVSGNSSRREIMFEVG